MIYYVVELASDFLKKISVAWAREFDLNKTNKYRNCTKDTARDHRRVRRPGREGLKHLMMF